MDDETRGDREPWWSAINGPGPSASRGRRVAPRLARPLVLIAVGYVLAGGSLLLAQHLGLQTLWRVHAGIGADLHVVGALTRYAATGDRDRYALYLRALEDRAGTDQARAELTKPDPDFSLVWRSRRDGRSGVGFLAAAAERLHPTDLARRMAGALEAADTAMARLGKLAPAIHRDAAAGRAATVRMERAHADLQRIAASLRAAEREYAIALEGLSAALPPLVERAIFLLTLACFALCVAVSLRRLWSLGRALASLRDRLVDISLGRLEEQPGLDATPELGGLVPAFEQMKARLVESHRKAAENSRELGQALRELENVMETIPDVICILDLLGRLRLWNRNLEAATGLVAGDLAKRPLADLFAEDDRARIQATVRDAVRTGRFEAEGELVRPDGSRGAYHWTGAVLEDDHGALIGLTVSGRNITERKALEHELARQAFHDPLTGLPNRALFMDRVAHALSRTERRHGRVAVLFLDLDRFKIINDSLGHGIGDRLLGEVGQRLLCCLRPQDTIARLGGDEFGVLLEDILEVRDATVAAERIANALHAPFLFEGREMFVTTSVGIALGSTRGGDPEELLRRADLAMYHAKSKGKARYEVFDGRRGAPALDRLDLEIDLRGAIGREEFRVYFQPIVLLGPSRVMEVEALVRWQHARRGLLSPAEFIGLSEETGLIVPLGRWILAQACRQARAWQAAYPSEPPLVVSVNLSARQLQQPELVRETARILEETELDPGCLKLEITESVVMQDAPSALAKLRGLKELGVQLAIDDFGTGYSSLGYLKRFPVDTLKIDRSFVKGIDRDVESSAIVRAVVMMAKSLDLSVTAEGIETAEQLTRLEALGCDRGQGYYFAHPLPADPMGAFLAAWRGEHLVAPASRRNGRRGAKARRLAAAGRGGPTEAVTP